MTDISARGTPASVPEQVKALSTSTVPDTVSVLDNRILKALADRRLLIDEAAKPY